MPGRCRPDRAMAKPSRDPTQHDLKHTALEDAHGLTLGVFFCAMGVLVLTHLGFVTGQTAGIAVILSYLTGWSFGAIFFVINLPFYWFGYRRFGWAFTWKSLACVTLLSLMTEALPGQFQIAALTPWLGAILLGVLIGTGLLVIFRHGGSLGGLGVVALAVQDATGFRAGYVQLAADAVIFAVCAVLFPLSLVAWSLLGAVVLNLVIAFNHRRDRYLGT